MNLIPLINQLAQILPQYTSLFSDTVSVTSLTRTGTVATAITSVDHGFIVGQYVNISGAVELVPLTSLTFSAGIVSAQSVVKNNLSLNFDYLTKKPLSVVTIEIQGADQAEYNGEHTLSSVPNRNLFTYAISGNPVTPATGSPVLYSYAYNYFNGLKQITSTPTTDSFTFDISADASLDTAGIILAHSNFRISGAATDTRAIDAYTKQDFENWWLFVTAGESNTSKNREILNDSLMTNKDGSAQEYRLRLVEDVGLVIFSPTKDDIGGIDSLTTLETDAKLAIFKTLLRFKATEQYDANSGFTYIYQDGNLLQYDSAPAFMVYKMTLQVEYDVTYYDTYIPNTYAPLLDISMSLNINGGEVFADINLDEDS
jgi:hypothetical protein